MADNVVSRFAIYGGAHIDRIGRLDEKAGLGLSNPGRFQEQVGGAAANVASNLAALGANVLLKASVGEDAAGQAVDKELNRRNVQTDLRVLPNHATATYTSIIEPSGDLLLAVADMAVHEELWPDIVVSPATCTCIDTNLSEKVLHQISEKRGKLAALTVSAAKAPRLRSILPRVDILLTNRAEACSLFNLPQNATTDQLENCLKNTPVDIVVISDGSNPILYRDNDMIGSRSFDPHDKIIDVIGAGDGLGSGVLFALENGSDLKTALRFGIRVAGALLDVAGPYRSDLKTLL